jgi:mRNA interferase RelE/StbE
VAKFNIRIKPSAVKELEAIPQKKDRQKIAARIQALADDPRPHGCQKLSGQERYRIRQGWYRIIYAIDDQQVTVFVIKIGHRKDIYR